MPGPDLAQYGIAFFAVAGLIYIITKACIGVRGGGESRPEAVFLFGEGEVTNG